VTPSLPWVFEPCENEGPICDPAGQPWQHAVRGRKPAGRLVTGYGHTAPAADHDARQKAQQYDAREVLGERGEVITKQVFDAPILARLNKEYGWRIELEDFHI
jgi:hypothetical protein